MIMKIFHFLALFAYLNTITYHEGSSFSNSERFDLDGDSLVEFILEDVLDLPLHQEDDDLEMPYDEYRISVIHATLPPLFIRYNNFSIPITPLEDPQIITSLFGSKILLTPGYYTYLFRLKPF